MTKQEYKEFLNYELYYYFRQKGSNPNFFDRIRTKYFQPNTNCILLARKMWYLYAGVFFRKFEQN